MDIKDIQNLQEAYLEVYQVDEAKQESDEEDWRKSEIRNLRRHRQTGTRTPYTDRIVSHAKGRGVKKERGSKVQREEIEISEAEKWIQKAIKKPGALSKQLGVPEDENIPADKLAAAAKKGGKLGKRARLAMTLKGLRREEIDVYDIVFSHLLDEGYADTEDAAVAIMANMSEEWRQSIVESLVVESTPSDVVRDRLDDRRAYQSRVVDAMAQGTSPVGLRRRELAQQREKEFNAYRKKQDQDPYYKIKSFKDIPGTFRKK